MNDFDGSGAPAGPHVIRAMNEQLVLGHLRRAGELSRGTLTHLTGLSKPTVSLTVTNLENRGLVQRSRVRTGSPGPAPVMYEIRPDAGHVLSLDVGTQYLRGALCDLSGRRRAAFDAPAEATSVIGRVAELAGLAAKLEAEAGIESTDVIQTVLGTPGVYDPRLDTLTLTGAQPDWEQPDMLIRLRTALGPFLMIENDVDAAAMAEREYGHGRDVDSFVFVSIGTGIGMGLVMDGQLRRGSHGAAGEIGFLPIQRDGAHDTRDARRRGRLEAAASAAGIVRAARQAGMRKIGSARAVFTAAAEGDVRASAVLRDEAELVTRAIASIIAVVDPQLVVLGGGIGRAEGFIDAVAGLLPRFAPVLPELRVSALGAEAVVDGCLVAGLDRAWSRVAPGRRGGTAGESGSEA